MMQKIAIGADHAGYELKEQLKKWLDQNGYASRDYGTFSTASADYPDFAQFLVELGIDSISVTPDSVLKTYNAISEVEKKL